MVKAYTTRMRALTLTIYALLVTSCGDGSAQAPLAPAEAPLAYTAGSGLIATPPMRGSLGAFKFETEHQGFDFEIKTRGNADIVTLTATGGAGAHSGWHYHPGPAIVIVKRGTLTSYVVEEGNCMKRVYPAGTALIEGTSPHIVVNEGDADIELSVVFFTPSGTQQRIDAPDPGVC